MSAIENLTREDTRQWTLAELEAAPVLSQAQNDNLMIETTIKGVHVRVWLCRSGLADGMPYDHQVTVEALTEGGRWTTVDEYPGT